MTNLLKKTVLGVAAAATGLTLAAPAEAQYYRHRGDGGAAVVAGIAGLAVGAALASGNRGYYEPYYYPGYYPGYYYQPYYYNAYPVYRYDYRVYPHYRYDRRDYRHDRRGYYRR